MDRLIKIFSFGLSIVFVFILFSSFTYGQKRKPATKRAVAKKPAPPQNLPKVTQIDQAALTQLLKREGENAKPLLINFWATWCDPCREEFPELVKIDAEFKGKIDFITISLDDLAEINRDVPKFLASMKATMPTYLLKTTDEEAAIVSVAKDWQGGLPFTILFDSKGKQAYFRQGKVTAEGLRAELNKLSVVSIINSEIFDKQEAEKQKGKTHEDEANKQKNREEGILLNAENGKSEAVKDIAKNNLIIYSGTVAGVKGFRETVNKIKTKYGVVLMGNYCTPSEEHYKYANAYNKIMLQEIRKKLGAKAYKELSALAIKS